MGLTKPTVLTGANAKIKLNDKTLAFCTDISYSISIPTKTPKILGMYEGSSVEPLGYSVSGSFTIIRYAKGIRDSNDGNVIAGTAINDAGNGVGNWGTVWGGDTAKDFLARNGVGNDGRAHESLDPSRFSNGTTFDIEIYQVAPAGGTSNSVATAINDIFGKPLQQATTLATGGTLKATDAMGVAKIRNARITQADFSLSKRGLATQRFNFTALYVDEDAFVASYSGLGQHFT